MARGGRAAGPVAAQYRLSRRAGGDCDGRLARYGLDRPGSVARESASVRPSVSRPSSSCGVKLAVSAARRISWARARVSSSGRVVSFSPSAPPRH
jgi:hypothetical protein